MTKAEKWCVENSKMISEMYETKQTNENVKAIIQKVLPESLHLVRITSRPFGVAIAEIDTDKLCTINITARQISLTQSKR